MKILPAVVLVMAIWMGALVPVRTTPPLEPSEALKERVYRTVRQKALQGQGQNATEGAAAARVVVPAHMPQVGGPATAAVKAAARSAARALGMGDGRIVHGNEADPCQFPHQVALLSNNGEFCGGSLISSRWVLTAAHCITSASSLRVFLGSVEWRQAPEQVTARRIFYHGAYNPYNLNNDIALLDLGEDVPTDDCLKPVELETTGCGDNSLNGVAAVVSGWGLTSDASTSVEDKLRWVRTVLISNEECTVAYNDEVVLRSTLCSKPIVEGLHGTICSGDSGGPLLVEGTNRQVGINSFVSIQGCEAGHPSGYVRVPCFIDWINYVMTL